MGVQSEIGQTPFFRSLTREQQARLSERATRKRLAPHQAVFFEGQPADYAWVCLSGRIRLYKSSSEGRVTTLDVLEAGEVFGAISALHDPDYPVSAEAVTEAVVCGLPKTLVLRFVEESPALALEILDIVSRRLRAAHERVRAFATDSAPARLAQALLRAARDGEAQVTRRDLAEASATTVETAIRVLRRFEGAKLVRGAVGSVRVLDRGRLERIAAGEAPPPAPPPGETGAGRAPAESDAG
jgi:CRP/FNR family transcriptional regulator